MQFLGQSLQKLEHSLLIGQQTETQADRRDEIGRIRWL